CFRVGGALSDASCRSSRRESYSSQKKFRCFLCIRPPCGPILVGRPLLVTIEARKVLAKGVQIRLVLRLRQSDSLSVTRKSFSGFAAMLQSFAQAVPCV